MEKNNSKKSHRQVCLIASTLDLHAWKHVSAPECWGATRSPLGTYSYSHLAHKDSDFPISWLSDSDMPFDISSLLLFNVHERWVLSQGTVDL